MHRTATSVAIATILSGPAFAQGYAAAPFFEHTVELGNVYGIERISVRTRALTAFEDPPEDLVEEAEKMRSRDLPLFHGTLSESDPDTAADLADAVDELLAAAGSGEGVSEAAARVEDVAAEARAALAPDEVTKSAPFRAALLVKLLMADDGVTEAYEDAAEGDRWEYPAGWSALQRVKALWDDLRAEADEGAAFEIDDMIAHLDALLPQPEPPEHFAGDPEEPEAFAHRLVGFLETVADADLYPQRDLGRTAALVSELAADGCEHFAADSETLGRERVSIARFHYAENLRRPLSVLVADAHEAATDAFAVLGDGPVAEEAEAACSELLAAMESGVSVLPPPATQ